MSLNEQFLTMYMMFGCGMGMGLAFDLYRVLAARFKLSRLPLALLDIVYWIAATALVFQMLLYSNHGQVRLVVFIGILLGAGMYFVLFSRAAVWTINRLLRIAAALIRFIIKLLRIVLLGPLMALWRIAIAIFRIFRAISIFLFKIVLQLLYPFWSLLKWLYRSMLGRFKK
ncbi:spore cortex biosynthesis protein YabQ [Paenibacillus sp. y28]|uniref:spore cortex biosynthesis protein YabQ n=1 Tax=Paenibacillus sp. y28 TaxID=3129110 RepID=UPI003016CF75